INIIENLKIFGRIARAFRTPGLSERYYFGAPVPYAYFVPNPELKPEISYGIDIGLRFKSKIFNGNITYFRNDLTNLLAWEPTVYEGKTKIGPIPVYHWTNIEKGRIQGIEMEGEGKFNIGKVIFTPFFSGTWEDGKNINAGTSLPNILPYSFFYGVRLLTDGIWIEASGRTVLGDRYVVAPSQPGAEYEEIEIEGFSIFNLKGSFDLSKLNFAFIKLDGLRLNMGVENLTNRFYTEPFNTVPNPGRTFKASLELKF
ncbi:MAG: TonB-dependent receptor, partial [Candidatus Aminicenantia bacterium]